MKSLVVHPLQSGSATINVIAWDGLAAAITAFQVNVTNVSGGFRVHSLSRASGGGLTVTWQSETGATYRVLAKSRLEDTAWTALSGTVTATGAMASWVDAAATNRTRFYRVEKLAAQ